jgi:hypothetical protein
MDARNPLQCSRAAVFLVTDRTGTILDYVRLVEGVVSLVLFEMAGLTIFIDRVESYALLEAFAQHFLEFGLRQAMPGEHGLVVTARAIVDQRGVTGRERSGIKKSFVPAPLINNDDGEAKGGGEKAD